MTMQTQAFKYQESEKLKDARAQLAVIYAVDTKRSEIDAQIRVLRAQRDLLTAQARFERVDPADLKAAQAELQAKQSELEELEDTPGRKSPTAEYLKQLVSTLERQEREENERRLKPIVRAALAKLDRALEAVTGPAAELAELRRLAGPLGTIFPDGWEGDFEKSSRRNSRLQMWRTQLYKAGWLEEGTGWTNEAK